MSELFALPAMASADGIRRGLFSSVELVQSCLDRISKTDHQIGAWAFLDPDLALGQARTLDERRSRGLAVGPLHGVPVGIKDIFDTADMPTAYGSPIYSRRRPGSDCTAVSRLREAGAVIMGKTVTTEFAFMAPAQTQNPHRAGHTPGGSSSGSAAAVAAQHVPLAVGSQSNGSVIRPASFCGVYGLKPSYGLISRSGVLHTSDRLDQVGVFARSLEDTALVTDQLTGFDNGDGATEATPKPVLTDGYHETVPVEPRLAFLSTGYDHRLCDDTRSGLDELRKALEPYSELVDLPESYVNLIEHHKVIYESDIRTSLIDSLAGHTDALSPQMTDALARAETYPAQAYSSAQSATALAKGFFAELFHDYDAIIAASTPGEAPATLEQTGDPVFCTIWTLIGLPCLSLPILVGATGLPIGVQLIGGREEDARLMRTAHWLEQQISDSNS